MISMPRPAKRIGKKAAIAAFYLLVWQGLALLVGKSLLLPGPMETMGRLFVLLGSANAWVAAGLTLLRTLGGYLLGVTFGVLLAVVTANIGFLDELLRPLRGVIKATPVTSFILLALLWLNSDLVPVCISFLMVLPIIWANVHEAIGQVDYRLLEMAQLFGLSKKKQIRTIYIPSVRPQFLAGCTTALGFAWKSGVAAEVIALPQKSVGNALYLSKLTLETTDLFAWTLLVVLLSMLLESLLVHLIGRIRHD